MKYYWKEFCTFDNLSNGEYWECASCSKRVEKSEVEWRVERTEEHEIEWITILLILSETQKRTEHILLTH